MPGQHPRELPPDPARHTCQRQGKGWEGGVSTAHGQREWMAPSCRTGPSGWRSHRAGHPPATQQVCSESHSRASPATSVPAPSSSSSITRRLRASVPSACRDFPWDELRFWPGGLCPSWAPAPRLQGPLQRHRDLENFAQLLPALPSLQPRGKPLPGQQDHIPGAQRL